LKTPDALGLFDLRVYDLFRIGMRKR